MVSRAKSSSGTMALSCSQAKTWVKANYERHDEGVVAKSVMYKHYEDHCREQGRNNMETSIFGRVVKSVFPDVTIRRLGGRDNLKYYYCGIRAKETSPYARDNETTTRPKRRLRKRELVTDKTEVHNCLRWLHANYIASNDSSVIKTDVYDGYLMYCKTREADGLSIQYFGMVVTHAFPNVTKRKLGPRTNQQKYYFGMQERPDPMPPELVPREYLNIIDDVVLKSRKTYRETNTLEDEDDDDYHCISPQSDDIPDMSSQGLHHTVAFEQDISASPHLREYPSYQTYLKSDISEPVDYTLQSLRLKDEPVEDEEIVIKEEPLNLHIPRESCERRTPDRPPSTTTTYGSASPSPPVKDPKTKKIYKPRFHFPYHDETTWNSEPNSKVSSSTSTFFDSPHSQSDFLLKNWIMKNLEMYKGIHVNRDQVYEYYQEFCNFASFSFLPLTYFDETILKSYPGVVTMIHPSGKTFYEGIRVRNGSLRVEELYNAEEIDSSWTEEENGHPMELSPAEGFPLVLEEEEEENIDDSYSQSPFQCTPSEEDIHSTPEVLRDGKFYLRKWLMDSFESVPDSCVLKADAYKHYESYARSINQTPFEMNVFGKIVRQVFPNVSIRRLGGRSKPQYHYCGVAVKPSSPLFQYMSGKDPAQRSRKKEIATDNRSAEVVIDWLKGNYEPGKDKLIMKSEVFTNYSLYCSSIHENPVTLNYFGKLVKHCFPSVEVRKFGGRSEPTWYYYGLVPRIISYPYQSGMSPLLSDDSKEGIASISTSILPQTTSGVLSPVSGSLDVSSTHMPRNPTSPIPIVGHAHLGTPTGTSFGSPSTLLQSHHLQPSLRLSPFVHGSSPREAFDPHPRVGSPLEGSNFFRETLTSHSPGEGLRRPLPLRSPYDHRETSSEILYSSSMETHQKGHIIYVPSSTEGLLYSREHHSQIHQRKLPPHLGGQVVPSQTPPSMCTAQDQAGAIIVSKRQKRPFGHQEDFEIFNDMGME